MKKVILILLCVMLIGAMALSVSAEGSSVSLAPSAKTLERGDTFTVVANLTNAENIQICTVALQYDTNVFELTGGTCDVTGALGSVLPADKAGTFFHSAGAVVNGQVFTFNFKVKENATFGSYEIKPIAAITVTGSSSSSEITATGTTVTISCSHSYPKDSDGHYVYTQDGTEKHVQVCEKCGYENKGYHDWNDGNGKAQCGVPTTITYTCLICQTVKTEEVGPLEHTYDGSCDTSCNNCDAPREVTHNYALVNTDAEAHWYECDCGALKSGSWEKHVPGPEATEDSAQVCTVCNYEIAPILAHDHVIGEDMVSDSKYHWYRCTKYGCTHTEQKTAHSYDDDCDVSCNVCNYIRNDAPHKYRPEWQANAEGHWQVCSACNAKSEVLEHIPGPGPTETQPQFCEECSFRIKMELSHVHSFGDKWYNDDNKHWQSCAECSEVAAMAEHDWDDGVTVEDGIEYTCSVCEKKLTLTEPMPSEPTTTPTNPATTAPAGGAPEESKGFPWQWAGIAAIVLMIVGVVLLVIEFIRSRKSNMHGKFSK